MCFNLDAIKWYANTSALWSHGVESSSDFSSHIIISFWKQLGRDLNKWYQQLLEHSLYCYQAWCTGNLTLNCSIHTSYGRSGDVIASHIQGCTSISLLELLRMSGGRTNAAYAQRGYSTLQRRLQHSSYICLETFFNLQVQTFDFVNNLVHRMQCSKCFVRMLSIVMRRHFFANRPIQEWIRQLELEDEELRNAHSVSLTLNYKLCSLSVSGSLVNMLVLFPFYISQHFLVEIIRRKEAMWHWLVEDYNNSSFPVKI